jgi:hypothetical protein
VTPKPFDIPKILIWKAYKHVKDNGGAAGVDQQTIEQFEEHLGDNLYKLWNRMCSGSYFPPPVRAVPIPKKTGGVRVLGVPTIADRVGFKAARFGVSFFPLPAPRTCSFHSAFDARLHRPVVSFPMTRREWSPAKQTGELT